MACSSWEIVGIWFWNKFYIYIYNKRIQLLLHFSQTSVTGILLREKSRYKLESHSREKRRPGWGGMAEPRVSYLKKYIKEKKQKPSAMSALSLTHHVWTDSLNCSTYPPYLRLPAFPRHAFHFTEAVVSCRDHSSKKARAATHGLPRGVPTGLPWPLFTGPGCVHLCQTIPGCQAAQSLVIWRGKIWQWYDRERPSCYHRALLCPNLL